MKRKYLYILICGYWGLVAFPTSHPITTTGGYTGAPLDSFCTTCHQSQNQDIQGEANILGLPPYVFKNETYPLSIDVTSTNGLAYRAGFQLLALEADLSNAGLLIDNSDFSILKSAGGKKYLGHNPAVQFNNDTLVSWPGFWQIEDNDDGVLTLYLAAMLGSGDSGNQNDKAIFKSFSTEVKDSSEAIWASAEIVSQESCLDSTKSTIQINKFGGVSPIRYNWNTGDTTALIENIIPGKYFFTVTDQNQNFYQDSIIIKPIPRGLLDSSRITVQNDQLFTIELTASGIDDSYTFYYENNAQGIFGSSNSNIIVNIEPGSYIFYALSNSGCTTDTLEILIDINTDTDNPINPGRKLNLYPNPATDFLFFKNSRSKESFSIYNMQGQLLPIDLHSQNSIFIGNLRNGVYIITYVIDGEKSSEMFIKY